ncbi:hypothetical protein IQ260_03925 [Leptolyngbya cf. ectocarpi LEGE 11479]|uniref:Uncharacterized protein n=1 Tax=Leptolyngbya cf. ectocarpi LEGE 11479 TaxID=1828722 RepID=A0A928WYS8_LEPEC|nr:hypothetical protein [Leptolyngbya ectocarpi]MBE9065797.1 hypothetical protein [Leptolyngbya cf. ectocarpi LEGE 11479]
MHQTNQVQAIAGNCTSPAQLAQLWAKRYINSVETYDDALDNSSLETETRATLVEHLTSELRSASAKAWNLTEALLAQEVKRHRVNAKLIDPWSIAGDVHRVYSRALAAYARHIPPQQLSVKISAGLGVIRKRYTSSDPRLIGFVSMQFHHCGQILIEAAPEDERNALASYFKVIDDHLYMPLQRAYNAAAMYTYGDERLKVIQTLLPHSTEIATNVVDRVNQLYPNYQCYTERLDSAAVRVSSVRDTEMFQIYLWTCVLEQSLDSIQQELFPLCVMLYPTLKVNWELVRQMLNLLGQEFKWHVTHGQEQYYAPYHEALWEMFSPSVFPTVIESRS